MLGGLGHQVGGQVRGKLARPLGRRELPGRQVEHQSLETRDLFARCEGHRFAKQLFLGVEVVRGRRERYVCPLCHGAMGKRFRSLLADHRNRRPQNRLAALDATPSTAAVPRLGQALVRLCHLLEQMYQSLWR